MSEHAASTEIDSGIAPSTAAAGGDLITELAGAHVGVVGLGRTGRAVVEVLRSFGAHLSLYDERPEAVEEVAAQFAGQGPQQGALLERATSGSAAQIASSIADAAPRLLIVSPGLPATGEIFAAARARGVEIWSEIELAWRLSRRTCPGTPWLAVTGTDGKTTTVGMLASILAAAGLEAPAVGNIGVPMISTIAEGSAQALAVELSSFQLHSTLSMSPLAAACLNVSADHLDWHGGLEAYAADKARIYTHAQRGAVYNCGDERTLRMVEEADVIEGCRAIGFGLGAPGRGCLGLVEDVLVDRAWHAQRHTHGLEIATLADLAHLAPGGDADRLPPHVVANALAACALALAHPEVAANPEVIREGLRAFTTGAHRLVTAAQGGGVTWIDDSKATNTHSTLAALTGMPEGSVIWLVGGDTKGADLTELVGAVRTRVRAAVVLGKNPSLVTSALDVAAPEIPRVIIPDGEPQQIIDAAVAAAGGLARPGDTVLLAPAAASWDQFTSYAQRGDLFAQAARDYVARCASGEAAEQE